MVLAPNARNRPAGTDSHHSPAEPIRPLLRLAHPRRHALAAAARVHSAATLLLLATLPACDFPTGLPRLQPRIAVPLTATRLHVSQLVPAGVAVTPTAFELTVDPATGSRSLAQMCGTPCTSQQGRQVPKPAFTDTFTIATGLPADVAAVVLASGEALFTLSHTFAYDPLRPPGAMTSGMLRIVLRSAGREIGRDSITEFAGSVERVVALVPGRVDANVSAEITVISPAGGTVRINSAAAIDVVVQPRDIRASSAEVAVQNLAVRADALTVDLTGVDDDLRARVRGASFIIGLDNPFAVEGTFVLRLHVPGVVDVRHDVPLVPGASTIRLDLSLADVMALLGRSVDVALDGVISQTDGPVTVLPTHAATISPSVHLLLEIGS